tara:strand:+ start:771 stop:1115 length:345 start_codon:yes stop_codon:yes gene_type:complete
MIDYTQAILSINKLADFSLYNNDLTTIVWRSSFSMPTEEQIQEKIAELAAAEPLRLLRQQRNQLLAATDWMAVYDRTMTQAQIDYRQALRDLPETADPQLDEQGNLTNVTWPSL